MSESDVNSMTSDAGCARLEVMPYHKSRGEARSGDINISRPAGIVSAREDNSREIAVFRGYECLRKNYGR